MDHHHEPAQHAVCRAQRAALMRLERMRLTTNPHQLPNDHGARLRDPERLLALAPEIAASRPRRMRP